MDHLLSRFFQLVSRFFQLVTKFGPCHLVYTIWSANGISPHLLSKWAICSANGPIWSADSPICSANLVSKWPFAQQMDHLVSRFPQLVTSLVAIWSTDPPFAQQIFQVGQQIFPVGDQIWSQPFGPHHLVHTIWSANGSPVLANSTQVQVIPFALFSQAMRQIPTRSLYVCNVSKANERRPSSICFIFKCIRIFHTNIQ